MKTRQHFWPALLSAATLLAALPASATIISFDYHGTVAAFDGSGSILPGNFAMGDSISGVFSYDDSVVGQTTSRSGFYNQGGSTEFGASGSGVEFARGSFYRAQTTTIADVWHRLEFTTFNPTHTGLVLSTAGQRISSMTMDFRDETGTALASLALPSAINLANWSSVILRMQAGTPSNTIDGHMYVNIDSVSLTGGNQVSVPEPGTIALFGLGLLALTVRRRKAR